MQYVLSMLVFLVVTTIQNIITLLFLKRLLKFINKNNVEVESMIAGYKTDYGPHPGDIYYTPILKYKINEINKTKQYELINTRKKGANIKIIVNKNSGEIITTKRNKKIITVLFIVSLLISIFFSYILISYILG